MTIIEKAKKYAISRHEETNHLYDGHLYKVHLGMVNAYAEKYIKIIPQKDRENTLAAAWTHDIIEDCRQTYNDVKNATNQEIAELTYALTNNKGKTRNERANSKYYQDMAKVPGAQYLKLCDRMANYNYSLITGGPMLEKYREEMFDFIHSVCQRDHKYDTMAATLMMMGTGNALIKIKDVPALI